MDAKTAIKESLATADMVAWAYLDDLTDSELMQRPHPQCHHLNWQVGHLILSEHEMMSQIAKDKMPPLPDGFATRYTKETAASDDPAEFAAKDDLREAFKTQRASTLAFLDGMTDDVLDQPSGIPYAPTVGSVLAMQGAHWLMHCGQWVIVRRNNGKPVVI